jgi:hypothetical protein
MVVSDLSCRAMAVYQVRAPSSGIVVVQRYLGASREMVKSSSSERFGR